MEVLWINSINSREIVIGNELFKRLLEPSSIILNYGMLAFKLKTIVCPDLSEKTIALPINLSPIYTIPTDIPYHCYLENGQLHLGPVIGYVERGKFRDIKQQIFFSILPKFLEYQVIKGLVFICTADSINITDNIIEGYYFCPQGNSPEEVWKYGKFPLPKAMFNRSPHLSQKKISRIIRKIGPKLFNTYFHNLDKWILWNTLSRNKRISQHLPYTERYRDISQIKTLLEKYKSLYLKPLKKSRGRGIMTITKDGNKVVLVNNSMERWDSLSYHELSQFLKKRIKIPYIVQEAVPFKVDNRIVDFRLVVQKDESMKWVYSGLMARIVREGVIITNMPGKPETILGRKALVEFYKLDEDRAKKIERNMTKLVIQAIKIYEARGMALGDVAADIVLDGKLNIWILELQLNQGIYGIVGPLPAEFFKVILTNPFKYAKALTGLKK